ncbi:MAG: FkbM family methyltransferase [Pyrinomonadaceae bacterium]
MTYKHEIRKLIRKTGFDVSRFVPGSNAVARKHRLISQFNIDLLLDVGANTGQFVEEMRRDLGYSGRVVSFEPLPNVFAELNKNAKGDLLWETRNCALGDAGGTAVINVAGNSVSSSLLEMKETHLNAAPSSKYIDSVKIEVCTLDSIFESLHQGEKEIFLKIDTQGFESRVLNGAEMSLPLINTVQLEMSVVPVYESEVLFIDLYSRMTRLGYYLISIAEVFWDDRTGELLQIDGLFRKF